MTVEQDILSALKKMNDSMGQMNKHLIDIGRAQGARMAGRTAVPGEVDNSSRSGGASVKREKEIERKLEKIDKTSKDFFKVTSGLTRDVAASRNAWKAMQDAVDETGGLLGAAAKELRDFTTFGESFFLVKQNAEMLAKGMGRFSSDLAKTTKSQSMLYAKQLEMISKMDDYEQAAAYEKLTEAFEQLDDGAKKALDILDEATGNLRTDLNFSDLAERRAALGDVLASVTENLSGTNFKSITDFAAQDPSKLFGSNDLGSADDNRAALVKIAASLEAAGLYTPSRPGLSALDSTGNLKGAAEQDALFSNANAKEFKDAIASVVNALQESAKKTDKAVTAMITPMGRLATAMDTQAGKTALVNKALGYFLTTAALHKGADGLKRLYSEVMEFNVAQIPASFLEVQKAAVTMGLNFKEASAILNDNKRVLAIYGPKQFQDSLSSMKGTFAKFGYTMAQGAELIGPTVEAAIASGINIRDPGQLNTQMDSMMRSFRKISGIVNVSAKEYMEMNAQMFKSQGVFENLMGMDATRSQAYAKELMQMRDEYVVRGLTLQQAQELIQLNEKQKRDKVTTRFSDAGKLLISAQTMGMGAEAMEMYRLNIKGRGRSKEESDRYNSLLGQLAAKREQYVQAGHDESLGSGLVREGLYEGTQLEGTGAEIMRNALGLEAAKKAQADMTAAEAKRTEALSAGSATLAKFGNDINSLSTILNSTLLAAVTGTAISFTALILQSRGLYAALGGLAAKMASMSGPGFDGLGDGKGKGKGKWGGYAVKGAKIIGGGLAGAALTMGGSIAADSLKESGHTKTGAALDVLSTAGGMALTGAGIGSAFPVIGTAVGAGVGGAIGAGMGLYNNWGNFGTPAGDTVKRPETDSGASSESINTSRSNGELIPVKDATVAEQLVQIANLTTQMVQLLTRISEKNLTEEQRKALPSIQAPTAPTIPSAYSYMTGRPIQTRAS